MNTEELRPLLGDLKLVAVAFDPTGRNSVAVLRDITTKEQYRVKVGQEIGRMRVAAIHAKNVVFGIEEFGYSRQESLAMSGFNQSEDAMRQFLAACAALALLVQQMAPGSRSRRADVQRLRTLNAPAVRSVSVVPAQAGPRS